MIFKMFTLAIFLTIILTWPLFTKLSTYYSPGDYSLSSSILWYNQKSIKDGTIFTPDYFTGYQMYPLPNTLTFTDHFFAQSLIFAPIYWITQDIALSTNLFAMITFVLCFVSSFFCLNYLIRNPYASIIGALVFTFNPVTYAHFTGGHFHLINRYFLPPLFLFTYLFFKRPTKTNAFFSGLFYVLNFLSASNLGVYTSALLIVITIPLILRNIFIKNWTYLFKIFSYGLMSIVFLPLVLYFYLPYLDLPKKEGITRTIEENAAGGAHLTDWLYSHPDNLIYGGFAKKNEPNRLAGNTYINYYERTLSLNIIPLILALLGIIYLYKQAGSKGLYNDISILLIFSFSLLVLTTSLIFGPYPFIGKYLLTYIPLPFYYLYELMPFMQASRVPTRFQFLFYIPFSLFVAYGTVLLLTKYKQIKILILVLIFSLIILENINIKSYAEESTILNDFKKQIINKEELAFLRNSRTVHLPVYDLIDNQDMRFLETKYLTWVTQTGEITLNGYSGYIPIDYIDFKAQLNTDFTLKSIEKLHILEIDYLIIHKDLLTPSQLTEIQNLESSNALVKKLENEKLLILDLKKFDFTVKECAFSQDFHLQLKDQFYPESNTTEQLLSIKNNQNCFLSAKNNRYHRVEIIDGGNKYLIRLKLPLVISPYEEINLNKNYQEFSIIKQL